MALNINGTTGISGVDGSASAPAVTGTDSNTGIKFASDTVNINTGGSTRVTVDSNGRLGIGTTSPSTPLHVYHSGTNGVAIFESGDADGGIALKDNSTSSNVFLLASNNDFYLQTNGSERLRVDSSGNLGLGTNSPNSLLNIRKSSHYVATNNGKSDHLHITGAYGNSGELSGSISFGVTSSTSSTAAAIAARQ